MIKSKIDAREKALELAVNFAVRCVGAQSGDVINVADEFEKYLISSADLPETAPSAEDLALKTMEAVNQASRMSRESSFQQEIEKLATALRRKTATTSDNTKED